MAFCTFCSAVLPPAPPGASVRCPTCSNLSSTPALPPTQLTPASTGLPFALVDGAKQAASPPPTVILPSRAGGVDELVGGGLTLLGISVVKLVLFGVLVLGGVCLLGMFHFVFG